MINEKKKSGKKDACYHKVKSRYSVWPSAYASGALVKCRKKGAKNWGRKSLRDDVTYAYTDFCHSIMEISRIGPASTAVSDPKKAASTAVSDPKKVRQIPAGKKPQEPLGPKNTASTVVGEKPTPSMGRSAAQRRAGDLANPVDAKFTPVEDKPKPSTALGPKPDKSPEAGTATTRTPGPPNPDNVPAGSKPKPKLDPKTINPVTKRGAHSYRGEAGRNIRRELAARRKSDKRARRYKQFKDVVNTTRRVGADVVKGGQSLSRGVGNLYGGLRTVARGAAKPLADIVKTGYKASTALNKMRAKEAQQISKLKTAKATGRIASSQADAAKYAAKEAQERMRTQKAVRKGRVPGGPGSPTNTTRSAGMKVPDVVGASDEFRQYKRKLAKLKSREQRAQASSVAGRAFDNSVSMGEGYRQLGFLIIEKSAAWTRSEGKNPSGGLNAKGVASYRAQNPGSKLKTAVTTKPSKLKKGSKAAKRRKSFCARMKGMRKRQKSSNNTGKDRLSLSLKKWNC